tara:strand:- start:245 stop:1294 length:1050 start_codon:yes stop_codon:yes gene_type:complete
MGVLKLNQKLKRIEIDSFEISNPIAFAYFDSLPANERDAAFLRAISIGVLALKEDRLSSFLSSTANQLGTELESLKLIFDLKQELFFKSAIKGAIAEEEIAEFLNSYFSERKLKDRAELTGTSTGKMKRNKTGDIVCLVDGSDELKIAIECKFDKSIRMGDIESRDLFGRKADTVWSQLLEAAANREGLVSIIVLDLSLVDGAVLREVESVAYIPEVGFVSIVDTQRGDYSNLLIAYKLARDIATTARVSEVDHRLLEIIIRRIIKDIRDTLGIESMVKINISNNQMILKTINKSLVSMEFSLSVMQRYLETGALTKEELFGFYLGEEARNKYAVLEPEIEQLGKLVED